MHRGLSCEQKIDPVDGTCARVVDESSGPSISSNSHVGFVVGLQRVLDVGARLGHRRVLGGTGGGVFDVVLVVTGGILLGEVNDFEHIVILAKVPKVTFHAWAVPGDSIVYTATLTDARDEGGSVDVTAHVGDRLIAEAEIMFVHLDQRDAQFGAIDQKNFVFSMNLLGILEVGKAGDGAE